MTEEKKDLKKGEAETLAEKETAAEKKPDSSTEDELLKKQEDEEKKKLEEDLAKERKAREDQEKGRIKAEEKAKELEIRLEAKTQTSDSQDDEIPEWRRKEKEKERVEILSLAQKQIVDEFPSLRNDAEWDKFKKVHDKYEGPRSNTLEGIKEEYRGFLRMANIADQTQSSDSLVVDSGVGDTTSQLKTQGEKPDALTRPLNDYERKAVVMWAQDKNISQAEAEKQWRERKAKTDKEREAK